METVRLAAWFTVAQCFIAGAALADVTVPEPASMALFGVGIGGVALARKFFRRK